MSQNMSKERRRQFLKKLINENEVETQEQLVSLLNDNGIEVTQATVSRDIRELNLVKVPISNGRFKYNFINESNEYSNYKKLLRKIHDDVVSMEVVDHFIVIKTFPGNAHVIGVLFDNVKLEEMIGCICGNDTCMIIARSKENAQKLHDRLSKGFGEF